VNISDIANNIACDLMGWWVWCSWHISHLDVALRELRLVAARQTDHALVATMLVVLAITIGGLYRWRDPLYHPGGPCPHTRACPFYDPAIEPEEEEVVVLEGGLTVPKVAPLKKTLFRPTGDGPSKDLWWIIAGVVGGIAVVVICVWGFFQLLMGLRLISIVASALYGSWGVHRLGVSRKLCRCRHRKGCHLDPENCDPAPGTAGGEFQVRGNRPGYLGADGKWVAAQYRNRGALPDW